MSLDQLLSRLVLRTTGAFDASRNAIRFIQVSGSGNTYPTTVNTASGATVMTTAQVLGGILLLDPNGGNVNLTTPTAAALVAAVPGVRAGDTFDLLVRNTADAAETITLVGGTGVTVSGTATVAQNNSKIFKVRFATVTSGSEAIVVYSVGTFVH